MPRALPVFLTVACSGLMIMAFAPPARPCVRVLWTDTGRAVVVGRSMNWEEDTKTNLWAFPRGVERVGLAGKNPLTWTTKYGSAAAGFYDFATSDGVNEKGLAVSLLWLDEADYGKRDESVPGLSTTLWGQFYLDRFATVAEAVRYTESAPLQLVPVRDSREVSRLHLALADAGGDAAVIEYIAGKPRVYHDRKYAVLANSPPLPDQLKNLGRYRGFSGAEPPPAVVTRSADRFVAASRLLAGLPKPATDRQAAADLFGLLRATSVPGRTRWRAVADLTNRVFYFESAVAPGVVWVRLDRLKLACGSPVLKLDPAADPDLGGEASGRFRAAEPLKFGMPAD